MKYSKDIIFNVKEKEKGNRFGILNFILVLISICIVIDVVLLVLFTHILING